MLHCPPEQWSENDHTVDAGTDPRSVAAEPETLPRAGDRPKLVKAVQGVKNQVVEPCGQLVVGDCNSKPNAFTVRS